MSECNHAVFAEWLNASQISRVGVRLSWDVCIVLINVVFVVTNIMYTL